MTREEAIQHLGNVIIFSYQDGYSDEAREALKMAIEALKSEPCDTLKLDGMLEDAYEHGYQQAKHDYEVQPCEDAVSREAVIQSITKQYVKHNELIPHWLSIGDLPSVTPKQKVVRCKDCKHRDPETKKCDCGCWHFPFVTEDDDFCSYGETKMEGESE